MSAGHKVSKVNAPHYVWGAKCDGWRLVDSPELSVIHERMPASTSERRHQHHEAQQLFFVLAGRAHLEVDGAEHVVEPGEGCVVPPRAPHRIRNEGPEALEVLVVSQPTTRGDRLELEPDPTVP